MSTWIGAIIDGAPPAELRAAAARHRIVLDVEDQPRLLVQAEVRLGALGLPPFAKAISEELGCTVLAFAVQTAASVEEIEQWESGRLVRKLQYAADQGGWITREGEPQPWESTYFFADEEGTEEGKSWPGNLGDEITDEDLARYDRARAARDASGIMDLLSGGSAGSIDRLCRDFGVDPRRPGGIYRPPTNWKPRIVIAAIVLALVGAFILGVVIKP
ncbi:MAG: hypothetical protein IPH07_21300 [Deltaproteobacteria bacterium]|nr:hypothetical protein [Deltaproteobacteria bacterium]MBK8714501.1 hypothetical protein [Deltaproteobacteria bacterium]MBP7288258.1 hypothetical protein [Nannocystaceae bacterium]